MLTDEQYTLFWTPIYQAISSCLADMTESEFLECPWYYLYEIQNYASPYGSYFVSMEERDPVNKSELKLPEQYAYLNLKHLTGQAYQVMRLYEDQKRLASGSFIKESVTNYTIH